MSIYDFMLFVIFKKSNRRPASPYGETGFFV